MRTIPVTITVALLVGLAGCSEAGGDGGQKPGGTQLLPPLPEGTRIVLEAESGTVESWMVVEDIKPFRQPKVGTLQAASGGRCVAVPKDANAACKDETKNIKPEGKVTLKFTVPQDGKYYVWPRCLWQDGCSNSFDMILDGRRPIQVSSPTYQTWLWVKLKSLDARAGADDAPARAFPLKKGEHTLVFTNREDNTRLDQVYVTDDPDDKPVGIMKK